MTFVLGINCSGLHASACLVEDGRVRVAICEERLSRVKQDRSFPHRAIAYCCDAAGISLDDVSDVYVGWNPRFYIQRSDHVLHEAHLQRGKVSYLALNELASAVEGEITDVQQVIGRPTGDLRIHFVDHHEAHAAGAFAASGFDRAAFLVLDGFGEHTTTAAGVATRNGVQVHNGTRTPHSLGSFYSTFTEFVGFRPNSEEWKVMALAAYGDPERFLADVRSLVRVHEGAVELDLSFFEFFLPFTPHRFSPKLVSAFGPPRDPAKPIEPHHMDLVAAVQAVFEEAVVDLLEHLHRTTGEPDLVIGGGAFMNSVANGKLLDRTPFDRLFVGGTPDDTGISLGSALWGAQAGGQPLAPADHHNFYGRTYSTDEVEAFLASRKLSFRKVDDPAAEAARLVAAGQVVAWFQGGSEFGQRALGHRCILADPTRPDSKEVVNDQVKYREPFRPFGASVLEERAGEIFALDPGHRPLFMESVVGLRGPWVDRLPGVTHVDRRVRVQVVPQDVDPLFHRLIQAVESHTGAPVVLNTSFNTNGMPMVETPSDAVACFATSGLDALVIDRFVLEKPASGSR